MTLTEMLVIQFKFGATAHTVILHKAGTTDYFIIYSNMVVPEHLACWYITIIFLYLTVRALSVFKTMHMGRIIFYDFDFRIVKWALHNICYKTGIGSGKFENSIYIYTNICTYMSVKALVK